MSKGGSADRAAGQAADLQSKIAMQLFDQTNPLRQGLIDRSNAYINGGVDASPQFTAFKAAAEPNFAMARDQIIADTPTGGGLTAALADLQTNRARALTEARGTIDEQELNRALMLGSGGTQATMGGLSSAAMINAQRAQARSQQEAGLYGALGTGLGAFFGGGGFGAK